MKIYFQNKTLIIEPENYTEDLALQTWGKGFFKKVDYNIDIENNPFFLIVMKYEKSLYESKTKTSI